MTNNDKKYDTFDFFKINFSMGREHSRDIYLLM